MEEIVKLEPAVKVAKAPKPLSLASKMAAITSAVGRVAKTGRNDFHRYNFMTDADIFDAVRGLCAEHNVWIQFSAVPGSEKFEAFERGPKTIVRTTFVGEVKIHDGDSDTVFVSNWPGYSHDTDDKGVNKASTAFAKYAMIRLFHISGGGDDPDGHSETPSSQRSQPQQQQETNSRLAAAPPQRVPSADDLERRALVGGIYDRLKLPKKGTTDEHHAYARAQVAQALSLPNPPSRWSEFTLQDLRKYAGGSPRAVAA